MQNFNSIYSEHHKYILGYMINKTSDVTMSEELSNDVFMKVNKHLERFDSNKASMKTWIMNIAKNTVIDYYRKKRLETTSMEQTIFHNDNYSNKLSVKNTLSSTSNPHKEFVTGETMEIIENAISSLKGNVRLVAELYFLEQLSYNDIAKRLNAPVGTVKAQIHRARKLLSTKLVTI